VKRFRGLSVSHSPDISLNSIDRTERRHPIGAAKELRSHSHLNQLHATNRSPSHSQQRKRSDQRSHTISILTGPGSDPGTAHIHNRIRDRHRNKRGFTRRASSAAASAILMAPMEEFPVRWVVRDFFSILPKSRFPRQESDIWKGRLAFDLEDFDFLH
jgi:hypothetical protein